LRIHTFSKRRAGCSQSLEVDRSRPTRYWSSSLGTQLLVAANLNYITIRECESLCFGTRQISAGLRNLSQYLKENETARIWRKAKSVSNNSYTFALLYSSTFPDEVGVEEAVEEMLTGFAADGEAAGDVGARG
jgi:hypothetical protein